MVTGPAKVSLELSIDDPIRLFNSMDPAPFRERDLDSEVVAYIVDCAQDIAPNTPLALVVNLHHAAAAAHDVDL